MAIDPWPELPLSEWKDTLAIVHMWTQVVGKIRLKLSPLQNHWWTFTKDVQSILEKIRQTIQKTAPGAVGVISYQIPTFKLNDKNLVHFAAFKNHIGFYPTPSVIEAFKKELSQYKGAKGSCTSRLINRFHMIYWKKLSCFEQRRFKEVKGM